MERLGCCFGPDGLFVFGFHFICSRIVVLYLAEGSDLSYLWRVFLEVGA